MTDEPAARGGGLRTILPALVIASGLGYAVQLVIPIFTVPQEYVSFSAYWGALFLAVAAFSGVQHEIARSARRSPVDDPVARAVLRRFGRIVVAAAVVVAVVVAVPLSLVLLPGALVPVILTLALGIGGYALLALSAGVLYGSGEWRGAALTAVADPVIRAVLVLAVVGVAVLSATRANVVALLFAATAPFVLGWALVWVGPGRRAARHITLDATVPRLVRNASHTVVAALALGLVVSGLPLVVGVLGRDEVPSLVAGAIFLVVLARAPLVSPMLALQSYLTVRFTTAGERLGRLVLATTTLILLGTAVLTVIVVLVSPWIFTALVPAYTLPPTLVTAVIVGSAGLVAVQCVTGPAVLARGLHGAYSSGWVTTAVATLAAALVPIPFEGGLMLVLSAGPVLGIAVHAFALAAPGLRPGRGTTSAGR